MRAVERLVELGWTSVHEYPGGLADWEVGGLPLEGSEGSGGPVPELLCPV